MKRHELTARADIRGLQTDVAVIFTVSTVLFLAIGLLALTVRPVYRRAVWWGGMAALVWRVFVVPMRRASE